MINLRSTLLITIVLFMNITLKTNAQDWPELNRFKKENAEIGLPKTNDERVVFMGNSITQGWGDLYPEYFDNTNYINRGIGGKLHHKCCCGFVKM